MDHDSKQKDLPIAASMSTWATEEETNSGSVAPSSSTLAPLQPPSPDPNAALSPYLKDDATYQEAFDPTINDKNKEGQEKASAVRTKPRLPLAMNGTFGVGSRQQGSNNYQKDDDGNGLDKHDGHDHDHEDAAANCTDPGAEAETPLRFRIILPTAEENVRCEIELGKLHEPIIDPKGAQVRSDAQLALAEQREEWGDEFPPTDLDAVPWNPHNSAAQDAPGDSQQQRPGSESTSTTIASLLPVTPLPTVFEPGATTSTQKSTPVDSDASTKTCESLQGKDAAQVNDAAAAEANTAASVNIVPTWSSFQGPPSPTCEADDDEYDDNYNNSGGIEGLLKAKKKAQNKKAQGI
ncbi:hypothetical protein P171DRAFT_520099 [Karstenula rhodostoma CBS 690.94]|uniref:Uncharacterized protein n=1 Tax=Karstenula rhodostoma CBS 690.94 TaxID=1392251 RepID=A0A9P4PM84_9PLEO|nr:hypothetical protein P171DRAFT_520099 [Karstenula rhodostoma CBS 690.94]